ncbi:hypothetical protein PN498_16680 [Oscillatoria sp. CS-180]|uniref:hypothetical protein n=1 Tax=Oscillatoria sp. CS-180 TaxID=3021720 RepID=UPI00232CBAC2|nr:hypothetical protein [Oscillatoria sp. CS-180]MDB9527634.1 hypothetical protein [Oscillatoria sp. CS-180]
MTIPQYPNLAAATRSVCQQWCEAYGYSDPFCRNGEWWAFPPHSVMPVSIKTVMAADCRYPVAIGSLTLTIRPDGSFASAL